MVCTHLGPSGQDQRLGRGGEAEIERESDEHDEANALEEGGGDRIAFAPDVGISGEGDVVERRHELAGEDLGEEQSGRVDAEHVRRDHSAGDEHVRLDLDEPAELHRDHRAAVAEEVAGAGEPEARLDE
jgi:hypothetical protein